MARNNQDDQIDKILDEEPQDGNKPSNDPPQRNLGLPLLCQMSGQNFWT